MVSGVQPIENVNDKSIKQIQSSGVAQNPQYKTEPIAPDKFDKSKTQDKKHGITLLEGVLGVTTAGLAVTTAVCTKKIKNVSKVVGNCLKRLGKDIPDDLNGKVSSLTNTALRDKLTGLYNRACLDSFVEKAYREAKQSGKNFAAGFIDMDNFKCFNEVFDHDTGDKVLNSMAKNIKKVSDKYKIKCFRYGGEEFVVVAPGHDAKSVQKILNEINDEIKNDSYIKGLEPKFRDNVTEDTKFLGDVMSKLSPGCSIFDKLRESAPRTLEQNIKLKNEIIDLVQKYVKQYKLEENSHYSAIIKAFDNVPDDKLSSVLSIDVQIGDNLTLGNALDEIFTSSRNRFNVLQTGKEHLDRCKSFTCSGGGADLSTNSKLKSGADLVAMADAKCKTAKASNKNTILI